MDFGARMGEALETFRASTVEIKTPEMAVRRLLREVAVSAPKPRGNPNEEGPWCWQDKAARRLIRDAFDATHNVASALGVYDALTEIASDANSNTFQTTHAWIQQMSGIKLRTIQNHLREMQKLNLLKISTPPLRAPSTYCILSIHNDCGTFRNGCASLSNDCGTFRNDSVQPILRTSEESEKNHRRNGEETLPGFAGSRAPSKPKPARKPRERNELLDALASVDGSNVEQVTPGAWSGIAKALADIKTATPGVTPAEIHRRARIYRQKNRDWTLTAASLSKHWGACDHIGGYKAPPLAQKPALNEPAGWKAYLDANFPTSRFSVGGNDEAQKWGDLPSDIQALIVKGISTAQPLT